MAKATHATPRQQVQRLTDIINVGPATRDDLVRLGLDRPQKLIGKDPMEMYRRLCEMDKMRYDPCVLDVFISVVDFMNGNPPQKWWCYTARRKREHGDL